MTEPHRRPATPPAVARHRDGSPAASAPSPSPRRWRSTPRPRRSRPQGRPVDRLRRRRARLPDAGLHRRRGDRRRPGPGEPPLHARRRTARAAGGHRGQDRCATRATRSTPEQVLVTNGGKQAVYQAFADPARPRRRGPAAGAVLDDLPRGDQARRRHPGRGLRRRRPGLPGHRRAARGRAHPADQGAAVLLAVEPDRRGLLARAGRARSASGPCEHGIWVITDEIYEHLTYDGAALGVRSPRRGARARRHVRSCSTASPRPTR